MLLNFNLSDNAIGYIVEGAMNYSAINELKSAILKKFEEHETVNLYLEDNNINRFTLDAVFIAGIFPMQHKHRLNKIAIVTNRKWIHAITNVNKSILGKDFKNFTVDRRLEAIEWISSS